jgi:hypothetical protein
LVFPRKIVVPAPEVGTPGGSVTDKLRNFHL